MNLFRHILPPFFFNFFSAMSDKKSFQYFLFYYKNKYYPRFKETSLYIYDHKLVVPDFASFLSTYNEIFFQDIYKFSTNTNSQLQILDIGANIGLSVIYLKQNYPKARIIALEPDPYIFNFLQYNVKSFGFNDVELINKAAWIEDTTLCFESDGADGGKINNSTINSSNKIDALDITKLLQKFEKIDFFKMDIEGAEDVVFLACQDHLYKMDNIFIEYHSKIGSDQNLDEILSLLTNNGFRYHIHSIFFSKNPFLEKVQNSGFDNQLNIYATRSNIVQ